MTDWIEHDGGPQPVDDDAWVEAQWPFAGGYLSGEPDEMEQASELPWEGWELRYRILNQPLIDAALKRGIELGLEAAAEVADHDWPDPNSPIRRLDPETIAREAKPTA